MRNVRPGYTVIHPNRDKASCKLTRLLVVLILLASVALMLVVTIGGWSKLQGLKPVNFVWCLSVSGDGVFICAGRGGCCRSRRRWRSCC